MEKSKKEKIVGSEAVVLSLIEEGIDTVFGFPGGSIMPVYDLLYKHRDALHHILVRHEQGAVHAAQGYARASGKTGVCIATSGPGATNLITGIADAMMDSTPLVLITGQVGSLLLGTDAFQETDVVGVSMPITKWNFLVTSPEEIPEVIAKAFYIANTGRPGPVVIDITKNAQFGELDFEYKKCNYIRSYVPVPATDLSTIQQAADIINAAKKPYVLYGQGVLLGNAENEFIQFIEKGNIPAGGTLLGLPALPSEHSLRMGMLGMHGNYGATIMCNECDVLIAIGMRFDDRVTGDVTRFAKQAKVIHLEIDPAEINKIVEIDVAISGDVKKTLPLLTEKINKADHKEWINEFKKCDEIEYEKVIRHDLFPEKEGITMGEVVGRVAEQTKGNAIFVTDVGQQQMIAARYLKYGKTRSLITSGGLGTMGFGIPAAFGAKTARPEEQVVLFVGDGGFQMTMQELTTIHQENAAVKMVLLNNGYLGMVRQWQELFFDRRYSGTPLLSPDFMKLAEGFGIKAKLVTKREELDQAVKEMLDSKEAFLLEVKVEAEGNVFPMVPAGKSVSEIILHP